MEQTLDSEPKTRTSKKTLRKILKPVLMIGILFVLLGGIFRFTPLGEKLPLPQFVKSFVAQDETAKQARETKELLEKVARHMVLPQEEPIIATVQDKDVLVKEQKFFEGAENGDILFIFPQAAKAVIYSKKKDILINAGPLVTQPEATDTKE